MTYFLRQLKNALLRSLSHHLSALFYHLDPVITEKRFKTLKLSSTESTLQEGTSSPFPKWDLTFLVPLLLISGTTFYGAVLALYLKTGTKCYTWALLASSPQMAYHQAFPRAMWRQIDTSYSLAVPTIVATFASFLRPSNPASSSGVRYLQVTGNTLSIRGKGIRCFAVVVVVLVLLEKN